MPRGRSEDDSSSASDNTNDGEAQLFECKKCGMRLTAAEKDIHRKNHPKGGRRSRPRDGSPSGNQSEITLYRPVDESGTPSSGTPAKKPRKGSPQRKPNRPIRSNKNYDKKAEKKLKGKPNPGA